MSFNILPTDNFEKELKKLSKKYPSLKIDLKSLFDSLLEKPFQGTSIGKSCYKIRLAIKSKGKGKSGGARVITNVFVTTETIYLLSIYDKSEYENISENKIQKILESITK